jgi:transcription antitermination factor NusG
MFAWVEDDQLRSILAVRECVDVLRKVGDKRAMGVVSDDVIARISSVPELESFVPGDEIVIRAGRWEGFKGVCASSDAERVTLMFKLLGQDVELPFPISQVSKTLRTGNEIRV